MKSPLSKNLVKMKRSSLLASSGMAVLAAMLAVPSLISPARGAVRDWAPPLAPDGSADWAFGDNWGGTAPVSDLTSDIARFNQSGYNFQPSAPAGRRVAGLEFGSSSAPVNITTASNITRLSLGASGILMGAGSGAISLGVFTNQGINLGANQTWTNNSASLLTVWRVDNLTNTTAYALTIEGGGVGGMDLRQVTDHNATQSTPGTVSLIVNTSAGVTTLSGGNTFTGDTTLTSGVLALNNINALRDSALNTAGTGTVTTNQTSLTIGGLKGSRNLATVITTGHNTLSALTLNPLSGTSTYSGVIANGSNARSLTKVGAGTQVLGGANTYTGSTTVSGGTLIVNGSIGGSGVTVNTGATLGGSGTVSSLVAVRSGGTLSPGNSPGVATYSGGLTLETGSNFTFDLNANTSNILDRGTSFDGVNVTGGTLTLQSGVNFNLVLNGDGSTTNYNGGFWNSNQSWLVFDNANSPTVASLFTLGTISNDSFGNNFSVTGGAFSFDQMGNDIYLNYSAIPEPSLGLLVAFGLGLVIVLRRRKSN